MKEQLTSFMDSLKSDRSIFSFDEEATKQAIVLKLLFILGWDIFNAGEVYPEYSLKSQRVDYSLRLNDSNKVFIEVKRIRAELEGHQEQLLNYSFQEGVELSILTNGVSWWFYLPLKRGNWEKRKFYTIDLLQQESEDVARKFIELVSKANILSGQAVKNANTIYKDQQKQNIVKEALPKAWIRIISEPDESLVELLIQKTETLCGHRPDGKLVEGFLAEHEKNWIISEKPDTKVVSHSKGTTDRPGVKQERGRTALILAYLKDLNPQVDQENIGLLIEFDERHKHVFKVDWEHSGKEFLVFGKSGLSRKPSNAAKELFGKKILGSYGNIARKRGVFVDISKPTAEVIARYADVEKHIRQLKKAGAVVPLPEKVLSITKKAGTYFDSITPHKKKKIHNNILERKELWGAFLKNKRMTSTEFKKCSQFKPKGIAGFMGFLTRNGIATRFGDTFTLNDAVIPQIKKLLEKY